MDFFLALCSHYALKDLNMKPREKWTIIISLSLGILPVKLDSRTAPDEEHGLDLLTTDGARKSSCNEDNEVLCNNAWREDSSSAKSILDQGNAIVRKQEFTVSYDRNNNAHI
ncbi:hypothetical protein LQW54_011013 [Pestalotiopsis sp. IQ-011]